MDAPTSDILVHHVNGLLSSLDLPITIETPYDLTPSLLLAILESILRDRLPISNTTRNSQTTSAKVEAMKVFLGVLEDDVLQTDIGLSEIDPRRLAAGEFDEVVFVGETLCWLGRHRGRIHYAYTSQVDHPKTTSGDSRTSTSVDTGFSGCDTSETTATTVDDDSAEPIRHSLSPILRCIDASLAVTSCSFNTQSAESELCDCSLNQDGVSKSNPTLYDHTQTPTVRYRGLIQPVKDDIGDFEAWQERRKLCSAAQTSRRMCSPHSNPTQHMSPMQYTISLLNERARLSEELAKLKIARAQESKRCDTF